MAIGFPLQVDNLPILIVKAISADTRQNQTIIRLYIFHNQRIIRLIRGQGDNGIEFHTLSQTDLLLVPQTTRHTNHIVTFLLTVNNPLAPGKKLGRIRTLQSARSPGFYIIEIINISGNLVCRIIIEIHVPVHYPLPVGRQLVAVNPPPLPVSLFI